jgi:diacylglycerol O-acyltransferase
MRPVRPADDFMIVAESDDAPMHIGSLQFYDVPAAEQAGFHDKVRSHLERRLPATPLMSRRHAAPLRFDSDVWLDLAACDLDYHVRRVDEAWAGEGKADEGKPMTRQDVYRFVEREVMQRLDPERAPFRIVVMPRVVDEHGAPAGSAVFMKVSHGFVDGIGFQSIVRLLTDDSASPVYESIRRRTERPAPAWWWLLKSGLRFVAEMPAERAAGKRRAEALAALAKLKNDPAMKRAKTPALKKLGAVTSNQRAFETLSLPVERFRAVGRQLGGTINDVFLAVGGGALRRFLMEVDDLPELPIVINSARSYRRPEHGEWGNRIVALHPHLGTTIADPVERFKAIQQSMAVELARSPHDEPLVDRAEVPFGPKQRRAALTARVDSGGRILPGNIALSNVPGPAERRYLAGYAQTANYPTPILGNGRFLNVTMRRNADRLDIGIMCDAAKVPDAARIKACLIDALEELEIAARGKKPVAS